MSINRNEIIIARQERWKNLTDSERAAVLESIKRVAEEMATEGCPFKDELKGNWRFAENTKLDQK